MIATHFGCTGQLLSTGLDCICNNNQLWAHNATLSFEFAAGVVKRQTEKIGKNFIKTELFAIIEH
jgi:hypothetical protein